MHRILLHSVAIYCSKSRPSVRLNLKMYSLLRSFCTRRASLKPLTCRLQPDLESILMEKRLHCCCGLNVVQTLMMLWWQREDEPGSISQTAEKRRRQKQQKMEKKSCGESFVCGIGQCSINNNKSATIIIITIIIVPIRSPTIIVPIIAIISCNNYHHYTRA